MSSGYDFELKTNKS